MTEGISMNFYGEEAHGELRWDVERHGYPCLVCPMAVGKLAPGASRLGTWTHVAESDQEKTSSVKFSSSSEIVLNYVDKT